MEGCKARVEKRVDYKIEKGKKSRGGENIFPAIFYFNF